MEDAHEISVIWPIVAPGEPQENVLFALEPEKGDQRSRADRAKSKCIGLPHKGDQLLIGSGTSYFGLVGQLHPSEGILERHHCRLVSVRHSPGAPADIHSQLGGASPVASAAFKEPCMEAVGGAWRNALRRNALQGQLAEAAAILECVPGD